VKKMFKNVYLLLLVFSHTDIKGAFPPPTGLEYEAWNETP